MTEIWENIFGCATKFRKGQKFQNFYLRTFSLRILQNRNLTALTCFLCSTCASSKCYKKSSNFSQFPHGTYKVITEYNYDSNSLGLLGEEHHSSFIWCCSELFIGQSFFTLVIQAFQPSRLPFAPTTCLIKLQANYIYTHLGMDQLPEKPPLLSILDVSLLLLLLPTPRVKCVL